MLYRLMSPGEGAYRLQLTQVDGEEVAEVIFAGEDDETSVDLPPGEYSARVTELGQPARSGQKFRLRLSPDDQHVRLADWSDQLLPVLTNYFTPSIRSTRLPRPSQLASVSRDKDVSTATDPYTLLTPRLLDNNSSELVPIYDLVPTLAQSRGIVPTYNARQEVVELLPDISRPARQRAFAIAISEDRSPQHAGSWTRPQLVEVARMAMDDGLKFRVKQSPGRVPRSGYRARLTIGLEGVPAIRVPLPMFVGGSTAEIRPIVVGGQVDFAVEIQATDDRVQSLVAALAELPSDDALKVLAWNADARVSDAVMILAQKKHDLWAATAAALLLVRTRRIEEVAQWPLNLARLAPHIPDASIAAAWARATTGTGGRLNTERQVMKYLLRGLSVGAPTFSIANSLALEMLNTLRNTAADGDLRSAARDLYVRTARRSRYRVYRGPYMLWEQPGSRLQSGRLQGPRYQELVRGQL